MKNFDTALDHHGVTRMVKQKTTVQVVITETTKVYRPIHERRSYRIKQDSEWQWRELADYLADERESRFGRVERNSLQEQRVLNPFLKRWGPLAPKIARYVFDVCGGYWLEEAVDLRRFMKANDPYFAVPISERMAPSGLAPW